jgi:uroporphyrinogen decarboxylase
MTDPIQPALKTPLTVGILDLNDDPTVARLKSHIQKQGGTVHRLPLKTAANPAPAFSNLLSELSIGAIDIMMFRTGAGVAQFMKNLRHHDRQRALNCLADIQLIAASPNASKELRSHGLTPNVAVDVDANWRNVLTTIDQKYRATDRSGSPLATLHVALEDCADWFSLSSGLEARGARLRPMELFPRLVEVPKLTAQDFFEQIEANAFEAFWFKSAVDAKIFLRLSKQFGRARLTDHLLDHHIVVSGSKAASEILTDRGIPIDVTCDQTTIAASLDHVTTQLPSLRTRKSNSIKSMSGPSSSSNDPNAPWYNSPFMKACRGEPTDVTPIWMMRQAGRYMAEYREVRANVSFLELCANSQLCSEVMCTAVNRLGVDAAIIFSDILPILVPMGCDLEFVKGDGPVIHNPVRTTADIDRIKPLDSTAELEFVMETVRLTRQDLPADMPLIGFSGAPFTLASYMIEGGSSRNYANAKTLMHGDPGAWDQLMQHLVQSISIYLNGQIQAGAQCVQLFDSWAGCLSFEDYRTHVHPHVQKVNASLPSDVPVINFATGNPALLPLLADTSASVIGIDWRTRLDDAWQTVGHDRAVQGNLDPTVLLTNPTEIRRQAKIVLDQAAGRPGHIFNLGHGILPMTDVDNAIALVDAVHELSQR